MFVDILLGILALIIGVALLVIGYRLALILLPIWGFFAGFYIGAEATQALFGQGFLSTATSWVVGFIIALIFAVLAYLFWYFAVVILGGSVGASIGSGLVALFGIAPGLFMGAVAAIFAVVFAVLTMLFGIPKYLLMALTALIGSGTVIAGILLIFGQVSRTTLQDGAVEAVVHASALWGIVYLALALVGFALQYQSSREFELDAPALRGMA